MTNKIAGAGWRKSAGDLRQHFGSHCSIVGLTNAGADFQITWSGKIYNLVSSQLPTHFITNHSLPRSTNTESFNYRHDISDLIRNQQWQCRSCDQVFESRDKRDYYHHNEHQKTVTMRDYSNQWTKVSRHTSKELICSRGKKFLHVQSLQRHS